MSKAQDGHDLRDEGGFALIAVVLLLAVLLIIALVAFGDTGVNGNGTIRAAATSDADAAANAGLAATSYDITQAAQAVNGNPLGFPCQVTGNVSGSVNPVNGGSDSYAVTVTYYSADWATGSSPSGTPISCQVEAGSSNPVAVSIPQAAVVSSVGTAVFDGNTQSETIREHLGISPSGQSFVAFSGSSSALNLTNLQIPSPKAQPGQTLPSPGIIYTNGPVSNSGGCANMYATIEAGGSSSLNGCTIGGSIGVGSGNLTLNNTTVDGFQVTDAGGDIYLGKSTLDGNATASGNVVACPSATFTSCSGLTNNTTIDGSATASTGSVWLGNNEQTSSANPPTCTSVSANGDSVKGCISSQQDEQVTPPAAFQLPALLAPTTGSSAYAAWSAAGYSVISTSTCTGTASPSVAYYLGNMTGPTVILASCSLSITQSINIKYNAAIFATGGLTIGGGAAFNNAAGAPYVPTLQFIVPQPSGFTPSSCPGSLGITDSNGGAIKGGMTSFFYTPCTFSTSGGGFNLTGGIVAGTLSTSNAISMTYSQITTPSLVYGYQVAAEQRRIAQL